MMTAPEIAVLVCLALLVAGSLAIAIVFRAARRQAEADSRYSRLVEIRGLGRSGTTAAVEYAANAELDGAHATVRVVGPGAVELSIAGFATEGERAAAATAAERELPLGVVLSVRR